MFIAKTVEGLEEVAAKEVGGKRLMRRRVVCEKLRRGLKTVDVVYEVWKKFNFSDGSDVIKKVSALMGKLRKGKVYALACSREGDHSFKSVDVMMGVGAKWREQGYKIDYKKFDQVVMIDIDGDWCGVGKLVSDGLCKRPYRVKHNNRSVSSCIAAGVIKIAGVKKSESLLDPFCKDGVIPVEAWMMGIRKVHALDPIKNNVRNAAVNCQFAKTGIVPKCYEATWLDTLFKKGSVDHMVTNMCIGKYDEEPEKVVKELFHQADFVVKKAVTVITNREDMLRKAAGGWKVAYEGVVRVGGMVYQVVKFERSKS